MTVMPSMVGFSAASAVPPDLVDWLLRLIQRGGRDLLPVPEWGPPIIPPSWGPWLAPVQEIQRRVAEAGAAAARATAEAAYQRARLAALDVLVGGPCLSMATLFANTGHAEAALLLREFVNGTGPQTRAFPLGSAFSLGVARSETTTPSIRRALTVWKARPGGLRGNGGRITQLSNTFVPIRPTIRLLPVPGPSLEIYGTPEAHVLGSFAYVGQLVSDQIVEWRAINRLSLKSYFADNWTRRVNISVVENNDRPSRYGTTEQTIVWRTTSDGEVIR